MDALANRRILVVDDRQAIHEDMRKILARDDSSADLDADEALLFDTQLSTDIEPFELVSAMQGEEGLQLVRESLVAENPFSLAFIDVRMPPGWDGITTAGHIMATDREIQIVICSAYSDHAPQQILNRLGYTDRLLYLRKPFDVAEVVMLATTLNTKWHLCQASATFMEILAERAFDMDALSNDK